MIRVGEALRDFLLADSGISTLVGTRVWPDHLPDSYDYGSRPQAIVIADVEERHPTHSATIDVTASFECYGSTDINCDAVKVAVHDYLDALRGSSVDTFICADTRHVQTLGVQESPDIAGLWEQIVIFTLILKRD